MPAAVAGASTAALLVAMLAAGCGGQAPDGRAGPLVGPSPEPPAASSRPLVPEAAFPVGLVASPDGSVVYAERLTGRVRAIGPDGVLRPEPIAEVAVAGATDDQRGLVGLSRLADGRLALAWVRPGDRRLVVGVLDADGGSGTEPRVIWIGPVSADLANGGGLAAAADGSILIGIGDLLQDRGLAQDPTVPNRKILALDPGAGPDQSPRILSVGWNNPFALTVGTDGTPWVADNSEGETPERVGRADRPATEASAVSGSEAQRAPSGLVVVGDRLGQCGYVSDRVDELARTDTGVSFTGRVLAAPCRTGVVALPDGRLVTATPDGVFVTDRAVV